MWVKTRVTFCPVEGQSIHPKKDKVCGFCFPVQQNLRKKCEILRQSVCRIFKIVSGFRTPPFWMYGTKCGVKKYANDLSSILKYFLSLIVFKAKNYNKRYIKIYFSDRIVMIEQSGKLFGFEC